MGKGPPHTLSSALQAARAAPHTCRVGEPLWHLQDSGEGGELSEPHCLLPQPTSSDQSHHPAYAVCPDSHPTPQNYNQHLSCLISSHKD